MDYFDPTTIGRDLGENWALKATNLKKVLRNLEEYYHEELRKDTDFESISAHINDIAKGDDVDNLWAFVELVVVAVISCEDKDVFVSRMMEMDNTHMSELQELIVEANEVITDVDGDVTGEGEDDDSMVFEDDEGGDGGAPGSPSGALFPSHGDSELVRERDELRQALQDARRELSQAKSQAAIDVEDNQKEKDKLRALNEDLQDRLAKRDEELTRAEQDLSKNKRSLDEAQSDVNELREKTKSLEDELDVEKSKVLGLKKSEAMVEVYRKKLDGLQSTSQQMGGMEDQTAKYVEQIMTLEKENMKIPSLQRNLEESKSRVQKLESRMAETEESLQSKDADIAKLKNEAASAEKTSKVYQQELAEMRAQHEGAADAALALNGLESSDKARLELENSRLRAQMEQMQLDGTASAAPAAGDDERVAAMEKQLKDKDTEVAKLVQDKEKLEAYTKKTLQKFQEKYLVALQECKAKLKEKHDKIEALEMRGANEKAAQKREEKLISSAIFELGMGIMSNRLGNRR